MKFAYHCALVLEFARIDLVDTAIRESSPGRFKMPLLAIDVN